MSQCPLDPSLSGRFPPYAAPAVKQYQDKAITVDRDTFGTLGMLPIEILQQILAVSDIRSLFNLQLVSRNMKRAVHTIGEFHTILQHIPDTIRIMAASKSDTLVACRDLYDAMHRPNCEHCNNAGEYLYLLACRRLCRRCLITNMRYRPLRPLHAQKQFKLTRNDVRALPSLLVPRYSRAARYHRRYRMAFQVNTTGWRLIDRPLLERHSSWSSHQRRLAMVRDKLSVRYLETCAKMKKRMRVYETHGVEASFSASVLFPWHDVRTKTTGNVSHCDACRWSTRDRTRWYYTVPNSLKHGLKMRGILEGGYQHGNPRYV